jgi:hypothetical protein
MMDVNSKNWIADLEHEDRNTAKSCQMCSIQENIKRRSQELESMSSIKEMWMWDLFYMTDFILIIRYIVLV